MSSPYYESVRESLHVTALRIHRRKLSESKVVVQWEGRARQVVVMMQGTEKKAEKAATS